MLDADQLSAADGMSLATEFKSETILVVSAKSAQASFGLRYFVPRYEMEMCVHGTIAAVTVLRSLGKIVTSPVQIETSLGLITVNWFESKDEVTVTVNQFVPEIAVKNPPVDEVAQVLRLPNRSAIRLDLPIASVSTSRFKLIVPMQDAESLDSLNPDFDALWSLCDHYGTTGLYPFAPYSTTAPGIFTARQFPNRAGYNEDPATGVAACALGAYLCQFRSKGEGLKVFEILQGRAMGRPSRITVEAAVEDGSVCQIAVSGKAEILAQEKVSGTL